MSVRFLTAGESHGPALVGILEGLPAGVAVDVDGLAGELARRRLGYGRSPRMSFEEDRFKIVGGVRHGRTLGSPIAVVIDNTEWPKWETAMAVEPVDDPETVAATGRGKPLTRPRPGHADLAGVQKYDGDDVRNVLERSSARETAIRTALGWFAKQLLAEFGITMTSHVTAIGRVKLPSSTPVPAPTDQERIDEDPVRCVDASTSALMQAAIDTAKARQDTLGGTFEVIVDGTPIGLGSHVHWDRRLDTKIAAAMISIPAIKAVSFGDGIDVAHRFGSAAHDPITFTKDGRLTRLTSNAGGIEGGISSGGVLRVTASMKPLSSLMQPLPTVDLATGEPATAITQRSDICAVPRAAVVGEAVVALALADAVMEKTGGDSISEVKRNLGYFLSTVDRRRNVQARTDTPEAYQGDPVHDGTYRPPE